VLSKIPEDIELEPTEQQQPMDSDVFSSSKESTPAIGRTNSNSSAVDPQPPKTCSRGWTIIRQYIAESASKRNAKDSNVKWRAVKQTVNSMSNMEKARVELYDKYLNKRYDSCLDGLHVPEHLLVRGNDGSVIGLVRKNRQLYFPITRR
jgi:hypothetical protein